MRIHDRSGDISVFSLSNSIEHRERMKITEYSVEKSFVGYYIGSRYSVTQWTQCTVYGVWRIILCYDEPCEFGRLSI